MGHSEKRLSWASLDTRTRRTRGQQFLFIQSSRTRAGGHPQAAPAHPTHVLDEICSLERGRGSELAQWGSRALALVTQAWVCLLEARSKLFCLSEPQCPVCKAETSQGTSPRAWPRVRHSRQRLPSRKSHRLLFSGAEDQGCTVRTNREHRWPLLEDGRCFWLHTGAPNWA